MNAFTLWLPVVRQTPFASHYEGDYQITDVGGNVMALVARTSLCLNRIGAPVYRMGRRDA